MIEPRECPMTDTLPWRNRKSGFRSTVGGGRQKFSKKEKQLKLTKLAVNSIDLGANFGEDLVAMLRGPAKYVNQMGIKNILYNYY